MMAGRVTALPGLRPDAYTRHALHGEAALWQEKNCYIDLWIELLHALGADPHAMLGCALPLDFEGDQWTFFKPSHDELRRFYGVDVQELTVWRPLAEHAAEHLGAGKLISVESDAFWLPDTAGTDYRRQHSKTTIVLAEVDFDACRAVYFHNAGCFELQGEDFDHTLQTLPPAAKPPLPLFAELVRTDRLRLRPAAELRSLALATLPEHLCWRPRDNPVRRFGQRFEQDLPLLRDKGLAHYHAWAFGTVRQLGASAELSARWLQWMAPTPAAATAEAVAQFDLLAGTAKTLILKAARAVASPKPADLSGLFETAATAWDRGMAAVEAVVD